MTNPIPPKFRPLDATGQILHGANQGAIGNCFLFRRSHVALTAAHCLHGYDSDALELAFHGRSGTRPVKEIAVHPNLDLAASCCEDMSDDGQPSYPADVFWDYVGNLSEGEEFRTYQFPTEGIIREAESPAPRLLAGHYQRFFEHSTLDGQCYTAGELSIPAPPGLSGGPLFRGGAPQMVTGIVTSNSQSHTIVDSIDEIDGGGKQFRQESRRLVEYGVALMLSQASGWLDDLFPALY